MTDPNQREIIVAILEEVLEEGKYSHLVLGATLEKYQYLSKQQRAFITRVTQGTIERLLQIDAILGQFVKKPKVPKMKPLIRTVLRSSVYQIVFMDGVPDAAVCNEAVRIVKITDWADFPVLSMVCCAIFQETRIAHLQGSFRSLFHATMDH